ncbi:MULTISPECIES: hypothetical protein [Methanosarcina]|jgi:hypothetical protein|uniref:Uncharacterized protein n=1 Tax=Methanosarcina flavescens TaxID=1715806 RepID=A0A660HQH9_9EURY|nr:MULTISPECIES: hypothetical protein [Methanosarcina]AKB19071.1 hypothetical protein MSWHS_2208 [Methanosarcina sp. WWM596]AYK14518.1 hypothetical protein AOB57_004305 [Methanosarcina flavescens]
MIISNLDGSTKFEENVAGIAVFVNDAGTDATYVRGAIYSANGDLLGITEEVELVRDSWNVLAFPHDIRIDTKDQQNYILAVQGDGQINVPADGENYILQEADYGTFPGNLEGYEGNESKLSIYAIYR